MLLEPLSHRLRESARPFREVVTAARFSFEGVPEGFLCLFEEPARSEQGVSGAFPGCCKSLYVFG